MMTYPLLARPQNDDDEAEVADGNVLVWHRKGSLDILRIYMLYKEQKVQKGGIAQKKKKK